jgi:tetrahydromethanopterin S-methyltransferase subunit G
MVPETGLEERVARLEGRVEGFEDRFASLERRMDGLDRKLDELDHKLSSRIEVLDQTVSRQFTWTVGIQVAILLAVVTALAGR